MKRFVITYHKFPLPDLEQVAADRRAFRAWADEHLGTAMVDFGAPLFDAGQLSSGSPAEPVDIDGYTIIQAHSVDEVRRLLEGHPYLALGGTIQINECLEV